MEGFVQKLGFFCRLMHCHRWVNTKASLGNKETYFLSSNKDSSPSACVKCKNRDSLMEGVSGERTGKEKGVRMAMGYCTCSQKISTSSEVE